MRVRTGLKIPNREDVRRPVPPTLPVRAASREPLFDQREAQRFAEEHIPIIVEGTANDIEREFHVKISERSRQALAVNALSAILERTRK